jgi:hypothetical protein
MLLKIMALTNKSFCFCRYPLLSPLSPLSLLNKGFAFNFKSILTGIKKDKNG